MKKLIMSLVVVAACHSGSPSTTSSPVITSGARGSQTGAADPVSAVKGFLAAAKDQDLQAMGAIFGDADGPARDRLPRQELEQRELIMWRCLRNDRYDIIGEAPSPGGGKAFAVNLAFKDMTRSTSFHVVSGPANRWYVQSFDMPTLQDICVRRA